MQFEKDSFTSQTVREIGKVSAVQISKRQNSVPLSTRTCYIRDIFVLFLQDYCALQELLMKMNFTIAVASLFVHPMMSLPATPTHSVRKYCSFREPTRRRQVANTAT